MATVHEFYDTDFLNDLNYGNSYKVRNTSQNLAVDVHARVHMDTDSNAKYVSFYFPHEASKVWVILATLAKLDQVLDSDRDVEVRGGFPGEAQVSSRGLMFAGRVFIYHEGAISQQDQKEIEARVTGLALRFRGPAYAAERTKIQRPLAFISHDSRDKDAIARPIALGLAKLMCPVWFDEFSLRVGDRLRESIEKGLKDTSKCVLVLTPNYLSNTGWTRAEFNSVFTREILEKTNVVLPVWHGVSAKEVYDYSPSLADRVALKWSSGADYVVKDLRRAIL